ncbi:hypothetical protein [Kitasatospora sp. MAA4]|uniref:hypothetical protein n=1 Tax=Kitasatospora sp. MAA4 TaxID=3035093 RepID=UPI0024769E8D|nr:hypothetical protein [Kitasatospora sp. MAA4]
MGGPVADLQGVEHLAGVALHALGDRIVRRQRLVVVVDDVAAGEPDLVVPPDLDGVVPAVTADRVDEVFVAVQELLGEHHRIGFPVAVGAGHDVLVGDAHLLR